MRGSGHCRSREMRRSALVTSPICCTSVSILRSFVARAASIADNRVKPLRQSTSRSIAVSAKEGVAESANSRILDDAGRRLVEDAFCACLLAPNARSRPSLALSRFATRTQQGEPAKTRGASGCTHSLLDPPATHASPRAPRSLASLRFSRPSDRLGGRRSGRRDPESGRSSVGTALHVVVWQQRVHTQVAGLDSEGGDPARGRRRRADKSAPSRKQGDSSRRVQRWKGCKVRCTGSERETRVKCYEGRNKRGGGERDRRCECVGTMSVQRGYAGGAVQPSRTRREQREQAKRQANPSEAMRSSGPPPPSLLLRRRQGRRASAAPTTRSRPRRAWPT